MSDADQWRVDNNGTGETVSIYAGERLVADVYDLKDAERIVRAMNWQDDQRTADRRKLEVFAGMARSIKSEAETLEMALMRGPKLLD